MKTAVKGIVTVLLAGTVAVSMCACGDTDENQDLSAAATQLTDHALNVFPCQNLATV